MKLLSVLGVIVITAIIVVTGLVVIQQTQVGLLDLLGGVLIVTIAATIGKQADDKKRLRKIGAQYFHQY